MNGNVLIITGDGGESYETWYAFHRFQEADYVPVIAAPAKRRLNLVIHDFEPGWDTYLERPGYFINADMALKDVVPEDYCAVLLIGGRAPEYLRNDKKVIDIVKSFQTHRKPILSICHGVQILTGANLVRGRRISCYEHVRCEVEACGGTWVNAKVVRDGNLVSSPTWREHPEFFREAFVCLQDAASAVLVEAAVA